MITILFYLLKVVLCSAVLYTYYWFVLRNKQFHQYNRFYLMGISVLSWIAPLIKIQIVKEQDIASSKVLHIANPIIDNVEVYQITEDSTFHQSSGEKISLGFREFNISGNAVSIQKRDKADCLCVDVRFTEVRKSIQSRLGNPCHSLPLGA